MPARIASVNGLGPAGVAHLRPERENPPGTHGARAAERDWPPLSALQFRGCDVRPMTRAEYEKLEGRVEFFDSEARLAWMVREPSGPGHEGPTRMLAQVLREIALSRGSPIRCYGEAELRLVDRGRERERSIQPDEMVFLHPERADLSASSHLKVGHDPFPDVVLEVDHTTDVRGNRLKIYETSGFPEVWVEVPDAYSPSRPRGLKAGLSIHLLEGGRHAPSEESRAFPGWRAKEIHRALNESVTSQETMTTLYRVGRALGVREGTGPADTPLVRRGRAEGRTDLIRAMLESRGVEVPAAFPSSPQRRAIGAASESALVAAASGADSFTDFLSLLEERGA